MIRATAVLVKTKKWCRRHERVLRFSALGCGGLLVLVIIAQLCYPSGRLLPFARVAGVTYGGQTTKEVSASLEKNYQEATLQLETDGKTFSPRLQEVGIDVAGTATVNHAATYSVAQRLIPFSSLVVGRMRNVPLQVSFDDERLHYFAEEVQKESSVAAVNATITVQNGEIALVPAQPSKAYLADDVMKSLHDATFTTKATTVRPVAVTKEAARNDAAVTAVLAQARDIAALPLSITVGSDKVTVDKATIGTWLDFTEDPQTMQLAVGLKADAVKQYLSTIQGKVYKAPGSIAITLVDGRETARTAGSDGQGIDMDKTITQIRQALIDKSIGSDIQVAIVTLPAAMTYNRDYSNSQAGFAALVGDIAKAKGNVGIAVTEIGGSGWQASANGSKQYVAASTYKLFVSYTVLKKIEAGEMQWSDTINGRRADECFDAMIVRSDNPCAKAFGDKVGWQLVENQMRDIGLQNTELTSGLYTTANDVTLFLTKLYNGNLVTSPSSSRLIEAMKRNIYRQGIPEGTGVTVADKVGFIDDYKHDGGIVYSPSGVYVVTIMTKASSWPTIADISKQIHSFLNR